MINNRCLKIAAISLGCAKNRIDSEEYLGYLASKGHIITDDREWADLVLINTCAFIEKAQQESINTILEEASSRRERKPLLVATGCLPQLEGRSLLAKLPELDGAIGVHSYKEIDHLVKQIAGGRRCFHCRPPGDSYNALFSRLRTTAPHSADVKIAEGCDNRCAYCLIPRIRGSYRSRPPGEITAEIEQLLQGGAREISLIAQDTTAYGTDRQEYGDLAALVRRILSTDRHFWLRIMYTYPSRITAGLLDLMNEDQRLLKYIDLPIQHASSPILQAMRRSYNRPDLEQLIGGMRRKVPGITLRTTVMVGFPGERRRSFDNLTLFLKQFPFERLGAFTYSNQDGTDAYKYHPQVPHRVKERRLKELMETQKEIAAALNKKLIGKRVTILVDRAGERGKGWHLGRTAGQAPEVDGSVYFRSPRSIPAGSFAKVTITAAGAYNYLGTDPEPVEDRG